MRIPRSLAFLLAASATLGASAQAQEQLYLFGTEGSSNADFGRGVADAGDVDGDGVPDLLVGAPFHNAGAGSGGAVYIYSGKTGALIWSKNSEFLGDAFGWSVDGIGDITGDGKSEIVVGAPLFDNNNQGQGGGGKIYVFSPATNTTLMTLWSNSLNTQTGSVVRGLGDVTGDGVPDFAAGVPRFDANGLIDCGGLFVYSGATLSNVWVKFGSKVGAALGYSVDVIRNGGSAASARIIVGVPQYDANGIESTGRIHILSGTGATVSTIDGTQINSWFGAAVAGMGDVNGDGVKDYAVSTPYAQVIGIGVQAGVVHMYSGLNNSLLWFRVGAHSFADFGLMLAGIGDVSGDGIPDLLIGSPSMEPTGIEDQGEARVVCGATGLTVMSYAGGFHDEMGIGVSAAGDLNGDGAIDYIFGANEAPFGRGEAYVHLCQAVKPTIYCVAKVNSQGCTPQISYEGVPSRTVGNNFRINASQVINQRPGLMMWARASGSTPFQGGTLCVSGPIVRTTVQSSAGSLGPPDCSGEYSYHFSQAYMASQSLLPGDDIYTQYWSRDTASSFGVGLTNALKFTVIP